MKKVAITGLNGVIGRILCEEITSKMQIIDLYHKQKYSGSAKIKKHVRLDLLKTDSIISILEPVKPDIVIHMAAITHIDVCETDKKNGKNGNVWKINVDGSHEIAKFCANNKIPLIFLSTECVFDGKQKYFSENSKKNPINWYGFTKSEAENAILSSGAPVTIIRSVVAYHKNDNNKTIYGKILKELKSNKEIYAVDDQLFTPTYTHDIVYAIEQVIEKNLRGIYHVASKKSLSPYKFALMVAEKNNYPKILVKKTTLKSYYDSEKAALRLPNSSLSGIKTNKTLHFIPSHPKDIL